MMETVTEERFFKDSKADILKKIDEHKPGFNLLSESNQKKFVKNAEAFLEKKFKDGAQFTKSKLKDILLEHFLNLTYPNSEYDLLLLLKVYAISKSFHISNPFTVSGKFNNFPV